MFLVFTTSPTYDRAETLANDIVTQRLAACVQILPQMTSVYFWDGEIRKDEECLLLIKTLSEKYGELEAFIGANHSYDVPEIVAIESSSVSPNYVKWLEDYLAG